MTRLLFSSLLLSSTLVQESAAFVPASRFTVAVKSRSLASHRTNSLVARSMSRSDHYGSGDSSYEDDEDDDYIDVAEQDWRDFRARLVMTESMGMVPTISGEEAEECDPATGSCDLDGIGGIYGVSSLSSSQTAEEGNQNMLQADLQGMTPLDPSQWAYDSGKIIEQGAVILGGVEQEFGFGLRQQYFHKAAILVLDHDEHMFTKGIILNRPTDLVLDDDLNPGVKWPVWFGGDVQGIASTNPDIVCLHSLKNKAAKDASVPIMKDIQWTTFDNAKQLVHNGAAEPEDFWVFVGYAGWGPGQLMGELDRKSWYMVATDSQTLLTELARQSTGADPRDAGLDTWALLMDMIGRSETADERTGHFDDLMLKEWALKHLLSAQAGGEAGEQRLAPEGSTQEPLRKNPVDRLLNRAQTVARGDDVTAGTLVRASALERSPFLLEEQVFHKSVILMLADDENISVGCILNRPAAKSLDVQLSHKDGTGSRKISLPLRFGGQYSVKGAEPLLWLHCSPLLRTAGIGNPVGPQRNGIWKCTADDVAKAIGQGLAAPEEFFVVTGVTVWTKGEGGVARGIQGEIRSGKFEPIPESHVQTVWDNLSKQEVLTNDNILDNLKRGDDAWQSGAFDEKKTGTTQNRMVSISGRLRENYDEEDDRFVFKSDVPVSKLSDDALRSWVATFLLGTPTLDL